MIARMKARMTARTSGQMRARRTAKGKATGEQFTYTPVRSEMRTGLMVVELITVSVIAIADRIV